MPTPFNASPSLSSGVAELATSLHFGWDKVPTKVRVPSGLPIPLSQSRMEASSEQELANDEALRIAKLREHHTLESIHHRNRLARHTPYLILYVSSHHHAFFTRINLARSSLSTSFAHSSSHTTSASPSRFTMVPVTLQLHQPSF